MTDRFRQFFSEPPNDHLSALMQEECATLAHVLADAADGRKIAVVAMVWEDETIDRIVSLGDFLTREEALEAEAAIQSMLHHNSSEDEPERYDDEEDEDGEE